MRKKWNFFLDVKRIHVFYANKKSDYFWVWKRFPLFLSKSGILSTAQREQLYLRGAFLSQNWASIFSEKDLGSNVNHSSISKKEREI